MYLIDYHNHTKCSPDSEALLLENAQAAMDAGIDELCVTDHYDLLTREGKPRPLADWAPRLEQQREALSRLAGRPLTLRLGLELGSGHVDPDKTDAFLRQGEPDFVIGSVHNQTVEVGGTDLYDLRYTSPGQCYEVLDDYFTALERTIRFGRYDVVGHIIYPRRYMTFRDGQDVDLSLRYDRITELMRLVVAQGKGIEVNTWCGRTLAEWRPVLERYRDLGGEVVTVGSDAHVSRYIGKGVREACELLSDVGFRYITAFEKRKPVFYKL